MNIVIAHPRPSYVDATKQVLKAQSEHYHSVGSLTLAEARHLVSKANFDLLLVDSELAIVNSDSFFQFLENMKTHLPIILTVNENETEVTRRAKEIGIFQVIIKQKGYLSSLAQALKKAESLPKGPASHSSNQNNKKQQPSQIKLDKNMSDKGYFVCDRKGQFLSVNPFMLSVTGYSEEELQQLSFTDLLSADQVNIFLSRIHDSARLTDDIQLTFIDKVGNKHPMNIKIQLLRDEQKDHQIIGYKGLIELVKVESSGQPVRIDQNAMIVEAVNLLQLSYAEPLDVLLKRTAEVVSQIFSFKRATIALLDPRKRVFVKQAMAGYTEPIGTSIDQRSLEVPKEVIDRIFSDRFRIKVIYYTRDQRDNNGDIAPGMPDRRTQRRRPLSQWDKRDLILLNLTDHNDRTFGYISVDSPVDGNIPSRSIFFNLELFGRLVSICVENYYRLSLLERRNRRVRQMLIASNIFKLYLSLGELLKEIVWSVKFTLDFNMVSLALISKKNNMLETKAVACTDKIKALQIRELNFDVQEFSGLMKEEYRQNKSYFVKTEEPILRHMKRIYYGAEANSFFQGSWPNWAMFIVPIKSREDKIIGFLMVDDPADCKIPSAETIQILEILANQIAIAIDNRVMYVEAKQRADAAMQSPLDPSGVYMSESNQNSGFKKIVEKFLR